MAIWDMLNLAWMLSGLARTKRLATIMDHGVEKLWVCFDLQQFFAERWIPKWRSATTWKTRTVLCFSQDSDAGASPALRDRGSKIKIGGGKGFRRFPKAFSGQNFNVSFQPKAGDLQKKEVFAEIRWLFLTEITNFNVFFRPKKATSSFPKKIPWGARNKSGGGGGGKRKLGALPPAPPAGDAPAAMQSFLTKVRNHE